MHCVLRLYSVTKPTRSLCLTELDGYGPGPYPPYGDAMQMEGIPLDHDMQGDYGPGMHYDSMPRGYGERY